MDVRELHCQGLGDRSAGKHELSSGQEYSSWKAFRNRAPPSTSTDDEQDGKDLCLSTSILSWRPSYLRRYVLFTFAALFGALIITTQVLFGLSNKNQGLATSSNGLHYLWTYGPTFVLTVVAMVWARVSFQAKLAAPWLRMAKGPAPVQQSLLLDYISTFAPLTGVKSLRNGDYLVAASVAVALILSIVIILSSGLITLTLVAVTKNQVSLMIQSTFANDAALLDTEGELPLFNMVGLANQNLTSPDGVSAQFAYQTVDTSSLPAFTEVHATVDGFSAGLDCEPAEIANWTVWWVPTSNPSGASTGNPFKGGTVSPLGLDSGYIRLSMIFTSPNFGFANTTAVFGTGAPAASAYVGFFQPSMSDADSGGFDENSSLAVFFGSVDLLGPCDTTHQTCNVSISNSTQSLCRPTYNISSVDIVKNGTQVQSVSLSKTPAPYSLNDVQPWQIANAYLDSFDVTDIQGMNLTGQYMNMSGKTVLMDNFVGLALTPSGSPRDMSLLSRDGFLQQHMLGFYQQYAALVVHNALRQPAAIPTVGAAIVNENRLVVRPLAANLTTGLLSLALLLALFLALKAPRRGILPRDPSTILGKAALVADSHQVWSRLRNVGAADQKALLSSLKELVYRTKVPGEHPVPGRERFEILESQRLHKFIGPESRVIRSPFVHPTTLRPALRALILVLVVGLIAALEALLQTSLRHDGLADVGDDDTYLHYLWTSIPSLILSLVGIYFSSVDFEIRSLTPFSALQRRREPSLSLSSSLRETIGLDLLNKSVPRILHEQLRIRSYAALLTTLAMLVASFLTVFTSSLFVVVSIPVAIPGQLRASTSFNTDAFFPVRHAGPVGPASSLILQSNLSYPASTYEDLALPSFVFPDTFSTALGGDESGPASVLTITATVPALRSKLSCSPYGSSSINASFAYAGPVNDNPAYNLVLTVDSEECKYPPWNIQYKTITANDSFFAAGMYAGADCGQWLWVWGTFAFDGQAVPKATTASALGCNETVEAVDVMATFLGTDQVVDPSNPPIRNESSTRASSASVDAQNSSSLYLGLATVPEAEPMVDDFFAQLTRSRYAIPIAMLGDPAQAMAVSNAIRFQHGIIRAQQLSETFRVPANASNAMLTATQRNQTPGATDDQVTYHGTATNSAPGAGQRRVVQDAASTRVLEALLLAVLLLAAGGWALMPRTALLPRAAGAQSIGSVLALLAGGNIFACLPPRAAWRTDAELAAAFADHGIGGFWMDWGTLHGKRSDGAERFMISGTASSGGMI